MIKMQENNCPIIEWIDSCQSTNSLVASQADAPHGYVLVTKEQTAGRGQRGNTWESAPNKNLTFSMVLRPDMISARRQFELSMVVSLAIVNVLDRYVENVAIKWPNDIYVGDKRICGILIENTLAETKIARSIVGVGLNVNQDQFISDAPNPVSLKQLTGTEYDLTELMQEFATEIVNELRAYEQDIEVETLRSDYMARLWRGEGFYPYIEASTGRRFDARIVDISPMGIITLEDHAGAQSSYAFKEVAACLD
jgi:BirA family biotin operon repressor/biotin-[acetyl-CoA-carboxylase] ligase